MLKVWLGWIRSYWVYWHHGSTLPTWVPGKPPHSLRKKDVVGCSDLWASPIEPSSFSWPHAYGRSRPWQCIQEHFKLPWLPFLQRKEKQCPYPTPHPQSHATACRVRSHGVQVRVALATPYCLWLKEFGQNLMINSPSSTMPRTALP